MSQPYVTGPAQFFVGTGAGSALEYLGSSQNGAAITYRRGHEPYITDMGGPLVPTDVQYMAEEAFVRTELTLFDWDILLKIVRNIDGGTAGTVAAQEVGTPLIFSGSALRLLVYWPYETSLLYPDMPAARNFPSAFLMDQTEPVSTRAQVVPLVWHCLIEYNFATGAGVLYDTSTTGKPAAN